MSLYGKQPYFCNACGKRSIVTLANVIGREWRVCSNLCLYTMNERSTLSIMGISAAPDEEGGTCIPAIKIRLHPYLCARYLPSKDTVPRLPEKNCVTPRSA